MITNHQRIQVQLAHADGLLDKAIAIRAGVSLTTVKRVRAELGLDTHCVTARRGRHGERVTAQTARSLGLKVEWRVHDGDRHDLLVSGQRLDVKTAMQQADGTWRFRLPKVRPSFGGQYRYPKDYAADCEVIVLCCLYLDGRKPDLYLIGSTGLPSHIRIIAGVNHLADRDRWSLLTAPVGPIPLRPALPLSA